jgi:hypothetical protein
MSVLGVLRDLNRLPAFEDERDAMRGRLIIGAARILLLAAVAALVITMAAHLSSATVWAVVALSAALHVLCILLMHRARLQLAGILLEDHRDALGGREAALIERMESAALRLSRMTDALLEYSRLNGKPLKPFSIMQRLVDGLREELAPGLAGRSVELRIGELPDCTRSTTRSSSARASPRRASNSASTRRAVPASCATTARDSTWPAPTSSSRCSSGSTRRTSTRGWEWGLRWSRAFSVAMAGTCRQSPAWEKERRSS